MNEKCNVGLCLGGCKNLSIETCNIVTITCNDDSPGMGDYSNFMVCYINPVKGLTYHFSITITPTTQKEKEATESMGPALDTAERGERLLQNTLGRTNH